MPKQKIKLLIIDDEKDICQFGKSYFERRGITTYVARTKTKAIALAKKINPHISVIDIHMGRANGIKILQNLLKICPKCKSIMLTWDKERAQEAKKIGAVGFVIKPTELSELEKAVNKIIKKLRK